MGFFYVSASLTAYSNFSLLKLQQGNFRRYAKAYRQDARADAGRYEEVMAVFVYVPNCITLAITRRHDEASEQREGALASVRMSGEQQVHARREVYE